jgi:acyl-CoA synthetase (AMP-forming)/AMP-acid ligase II
MNMPLTNLPISDPDFSHFKVTAVVELNAGQSVSAQELIALFKEKLGSVMAPKTVDFVGSLPRSTVAKVLKKDPREQYWQASDRKV